VENLPLVSTTPAANFATIFASVFYTGGTVSTIPAANLPSVPTTPVAKHGNNIRLQTP
jgi:hypothetical protein